MKKYARETVVGIFVVIGLLCVGYLTIRLGEVSMFGDDDYTVSAKFTSISGLHAGNPVEMHGLEIGRVSRLTIDQDNQMAVVEMKIRKDIKIYDDAIASVRTAGLIGDKYISISPGGGGELLKPGGVIRETEPPLDIAELVGKYAFGDATDKNSSKPKGGTKGE